jgi:hypothetical protein
MRRRSVSRSALAVGIIGITLACTACAPPATVGLSSFHRDFGRDDRLPDGAAPTDSFNELGGRFLGEDDYFRFYAARYVTSSGPGFCLILADSRGASTSCQRFLPVGTSQLRGDQLLQYQLATTDPGEDWVEVGEDVWTFWPEID